ncbi:MAG: hypothetical protein B5M53_10430 [Candidatus Cloacimonas sp. 4484_209]|nr:MAG: hypothetical protein B5M53_10430 [Candidatus Cloacimonas sp. 4484_209]
MIKYLTIVLLVLCISINVILGSETPLKNKYLKNALKPYKLNPKTFDPFRKKLALPQRTKANFVVTDIFLLSSAIVIFNPNARKKFKARWELITSPNHASPLNQGPFHFRTLTQEKNQDTQADKGVHFFYHYLTVKPVSFLCEYLIDGFPLTPSDRRVEDEWVSDEAYYIATLLVFAGGFFEEYVDGKEKDEGFSIFDLIANGSGSLYALLKHKGFFKNVFVYWSFRSPPKSWKWHKWDYMPGFEFRAIIDLSSIVFKQKRTIPALFTWWTDNIAYIPDVCEFGTALPRKVIPKSNY